MLPQGQWLPPSGFGPSEPCLVQAEGNEDVHQQKEGMTGKKGRSAANARANGDEAVHATLPALNRSIVL